MKIAIIGSGISGLTCAYLFHKHHEITIFEAEPQIGGHTATKDVKHHGNCYGIDTGFIVFNNWTYPNFIKLINKLNVAIQPTSMGFSVHCLASGLEYSGHNFNTLFAQRRNLISWRFWRMLADIIRFNKQSVADLNADRLDINITLAEYLKSNRYSQEFINHYLIPMGSAIWSASLNTILNFPILFFINFFNNHGLLSINKRPQWFVIQGGSSSYLKPLTEKLQDRIHTNCPVEFILRDHQGVKVKLKNQPHQKRFDQVILACHSDQALKILSDVDHYEREILTAIPYQSNDVILHTDISILPKNKRTWSSWNYQISNKSMQKPVLTYNMNILQGIDSEETFCITLNAKEHINPNKILGYYHYSHPKFSLASVKATQKWSLINGKNRTWFCGAYWGNGFHEDGVNSAIKVANALGVTWQ